MYRKRKGFEIDMLTLRALIYLEAEVEEEFKGLNRTYLLLQNKGFFDETSVRQKLSDEVVLRGVAGMLQDYYSGTERIFKRIAVEIDERLPKGESWHKSLLDQMKVEIPGVRPAVISETTYRKLDDLRGFRHRVGNIYGFNLLPERVSTHLLALPELHSFLAKDIHLFFATMKQKIQEELKSPGDPELKL